MSRLTLVLALLLACGGGGEERRTHRPLGSRPLPFALPGHRLVDSDTVRGIGGVWTSYQFEPAASQNRDSVRASIARALEADGWRRDTGVADRPYVLSREYECGGDALLYQRGPYPAERDYVFHLLAVHVGLTGRPVCVYATTGW
jgi:hypothetical protein